MPKSSNTQPERKTRRKKDPNRPKHTISAYCFFMQQRRPQLTAQHPDWEFGKFGKVLGKEWAAMSDAKKKPFLRLSVADAQRFKTEMENYVPNPKYAKKDPNKPKGAISAYCFYMQKRRPQLTAQYPDWEFSQFGKTIGSEWSSMTDAKKKPYLKLAEADSKRYESEMKNYVPPAKPMSKKAKQAAKDDGGKKKRRKKDPNAPKRALTAYVLYLQARRPQLLAQHPDWPFTRFGKTIGEEWRNMSDAKKKPYAKAAAKDSARYEREIAAFRK